MNGAPAEVDASDAPAIGELMRRVIATSLAADATVRAAMLDNARANLDWAVAHPAQCCHLKWVVAERMAGVVLVKNFWNLCSLFVAPEHQREGIGRALVLAAADRCRGRDERHALWLNAATNAVPFYLRLGFGPRSTTQSLPPGFRAMRLPLQNPHLPRGHAMAPRLLGVDHIHVYVQDRAAAEAWYAKVMGLARSPGLEFWAGGGGPLTLQDEDDTVHIALFERPRQANRATVALRVSGEGFGHWRRHLAAFPELRVTVEDHEVAMSLYFSDPDGNPYEITSYEYAAAKAS